MGNGDQQESEKAVGGDPDDLLFPPTAAADQNDTAGPGSTVARRAPWRVLVVDDDPDVHTITRHVLSDLIFDGRPLAFERAFSAMEARDVLKAKPDIAVVFLDVIMETDDAGLRLVHFVRNELRNAAVRILLRTGQPNMFPEREIALEHDINDYLSKNQTTADRLFTATVTALRGYQQIRDREEAELRLVQAEKMEALGGLAGGIAHDFNNILATVIGATEVAQDELEPGHAADFYLQTILNAGKRGRDIVRQILTFSRPSQNAMRPTDLVSLVGDALDFLRQSLPTDVAVRAELSDVDAWVMADTGQLHQVITNLCMNASQAMAGSGQLTVTVSTARTTGGPPQVSLSVSDTGPGIPAAHRNRIFEPFFTTKREQKGTGLGLAVVHGIVRAHKAEISVASVTAEENSTTGTCFTVVFPGVERPRDPNAGKEDNALVPKGNDEPILVVEDEAELLAVVRSVVNSLGYKPVCFESAVEAIAAYRAEPKAYRLILTDYLMPEMTGTALAQEVAATGTQVPVVLMSGDLRDEIEGPFAAILEKPLFREELARVLAAHIT